MWTLFVLAFIPLEIALSETNSVNIMNKKTQSQGRVPPARYEAMTRSCLNVGPTSQMFAQRFDNHQPTFQVCLFDFDKYNPSYFYTRC